MKIKISSIFILVSLLHMNSCNALKSITGGETELDPEFFVGSDSLFEELLDFWQFSESGSSTRKSITGRTHLSTGGTIPGVSSMAGKGANCGSYSGSASYYLENSSYELEVSSSGSYTIFFRYKLNSLSGTHYILESTGGNTIDISIGAFGGTGDYDISANFAGDNVLALDIFNSTSEYYAIALVMDFSTASMDLYVNGNYFTGGTYSATGYSQTSLGVCSDSSGTQPADGVIDSLGIWERALNGDEIQRLSNGGTALE